MRTIIAIALAAAANSATEIEAAFMSYTSNSGKNYSSMNEFNLRFELFVLNYSHIITHKAKRTTSSRSVSTSSQTGPSKSERACLDVCPLNNHMSKSTKTLRMTRMLKLLTGSLLAP